MIIHHHLDHHLDHYLDLGRLGFIAVDALIASISLVPSLISIMINDLRHNCALPEKHDETCEIIPSLINMVIIMVSSLMLSIMTIMTTVPSLIMHDDHEYALPDKHDDMCYNLALPFDH